MFDKIGLFNIKFDQSATSLLRQLIIIIRIYMLSTIGHINSHPFSKDQQAQALDPSILRNTGQRLTEQWAGQTSQKFRGNKAHVPEPKYQETKHPLFQAEQRKHFDAKRSQEFSWKPTIKIGEKPQPSACIDEWKPPAHKVDRVFTETRPRPERMHLTANPSATFDEQEIGLKTFIDIHNRRTLNEYTAEQKMGTKQRISTIYDQRNGMPLQSLGDKIYKAPEYVPGFFKEGGLVVGSTNQRRHKSGGNSKVIDFYAGIQLGKGPLNPNRKLWKDAVKEEQLNLELEAVGPGLKKWERNVLKEECRYLDPKYQVSDDSDNDKSPKKK